MKSHRNTDDEQTLSARFTEEHTRLTDATRELRLTINGYIKKSHYYKKCSVVKILYKNILLYK